MKLLLFESCMFFIKALGLDFRNRTKLTITLSTGWLIFLLYQSIYAILLIGDLQNTLKAVIESIPTILEVKQY